MCNCVRHFLHYIFMSARVSLVPEFIPHASLLGRMMSRPCEVNSSIYILSDQDLFQPDKLWGQLWNEKVCVRHWYCSDYHLVKRGSLIGKKREVYYIDSGTDLTL